MFYNKFKSIFSGSEMNPKVLIPIADGTEELEAVTIIDCLRRAGADVVAASVMSSKTVTASRQVKLTADVLIIEASSQQYDLIVLPGGIPGADNLRDCEILTQMLKQQADSGKLYAAICASPAVVLSHHDLLKGKNATCYPSMLSDLPDGIDEKVVVDGNCITSQGPGTAIVFSFKLIELLYSKEKANEVASAMLVDKS